jgi:predicted site-specific integrase-resolvase
MFHLNGSKLIISIKKKYWEDQSTHHAHSKTKSTVSADVSSTTQKDKLENVQASLPSTIQLTKLIE